MLFQKTVKIKSVMVKTLKNGVSEILSLKSTALGRHFKSVVARCRCRAGLTINQSVNVLKTSVWPPKIHIQKENEIKKMFGYP